ncbi:MAG: type II secretion system F family protein [Calditrichaeota bacterium]|nr:MAG: type II secretion system F family protein [Calditrichota bacterium]MBL1204368.1 type II secretion system F family protein [Calditrichota bacterium]NOG44197.1 type II secretion system F family protein [Calditrichota bacterium]
MPNFKYKAINQEGKTVESVILAADQKVVIQQLQKLNMTPVSIALEKNKKRTRSLKSSNKIKVSIKSILLFTKQLQTLLKAGIPIVTCLSVIKEQAETEDFEKMIEAISQDIEAGSKLSDALAQFPKTFPAIYVNSIRVGEISGTLEDTLIQLSSFLEEDEKIKKEVKKALRYPAMVITGLVGAFIVFTTFVIPNFIPIFEMSGTELPLPTRILLGVYYLITDYGLFALIGLVALVAAFLTWSKTPDGRFKMDLIRLKLPVLGMLNRKLNISRFAKLFHTMNRTGIPITRTFEIIRETLDNLVYQKEVEKIQDKIVKGSDIASSLKQSQYFSKLLVIMISIGEKSGSLDEMLGNVSDYYYKEVSETVENLTSMIEPIVTLVLGAMMLFLALAIFLPMWDMIGAM